MAARTLTWVVDSCLDDVIESKSAGSLFVPQVGVHLRTEDLRHVVIVLAEVGILLLRGVVHLQLIVSVTERHGRVYLVETRTRPQTELKWASNDTFSASAAFVVT